MPAVDYTNITRAIFKHMADSTDAALDVGQPEPFDPTDKPYWYELSVPTITGSISRDAPRDGTLVVIAKCFVADSTNLYTPTSFAGEIAQYLDRRYISVYDYETNEETGTLVGHIRFDEPVLSRPRVRQTWQEITITIKGWWRMDTGATLQTLPLN